MLFLSLVACAPLVGLAVYDFVAQPPVALLYVAAPDVLLFVALLVWVALSLLLCASLWLASPRRKAAAASETRRDALLAAHLAVALGWMAGPPCGSTGCSPRPRPRTSSSCPPCWATRRS